MSNFGRPTKYDPSFCPRLIEHMAKGLSFEAFAGELGVCLKTLYNWESHPDFLQAKGIGFQRNRLFWESMGVAGAAGKIPGFNATSFVFNMKNRFPREWRDRHEITATIGPSPEVAMLELLTKLTPEQVQQRYEDNMKSDRAYLDAQKILDEAKDLPEDSE